MPCSQYLSKLDEGGGREICGPDILPLHLYLLPQYEMGLAKEIQCVTT